MGTLSDELDAMTVRVMSPDGQIEATIAERDRVSVRFAPGAYRRYDDESLGNQLGRLATLAWVEYRRGYFRALSAALGETVRPDEPEYEPSRRRFAEERARMPASATSASGWVRVETEGLVHWRVTLQHGAVRQLTEDEFLGETGGAVQAVLLAYYERINQLKDTIFGLDLPADSHLSGRG